MKALHGIAFVLVIVGGLNWGLQGLGALMDSNWNVVNLILGSINLSSLENIVYVLVGISALIVGFSHKQDCRACSAD